MSPCHIKLEAMTGAGPPVDGRRYLPPTRKPSTSAEPSIVSRRSRSTGLAVHADNRSRQGGEVAAGRAALAVWMGDIESAVVCWRAGRCGQVDSDLTPSG